MAQGRTLSRLVLGHGERAWEVMTPIVFGEEVAGAVAALFSLQRADALAARSRTWALGLTAGAALVMALLMSLAVFVVVERPLHRLMDAIREVRAGTSEATATIASRDELGRLAEHFNEMMSRINRFSEELQTRVDEATAELARRYAELEHLNAQLFRMQRSLSHAERLAVAGRLLAEVAHEIGTPLHSVAGHLELLRQDLGGDGLHAARGRRLAIIEGEVARVTQIIAQLLDLARRPTGEPAVVDLNRLVRDTVDLVRPGTMGGRIELALRLDPGPARTRGPADQLQQVDPESSHQCRRRHPGRRPDLGEHARHGRSGDPRGQRHGPRHSRLPAKGNLRAVLLDQGAGARDGAGTVHRQPDRPGASRPRRGGERGRPGHHLAREPAPRQLTMSARLLVADDDAVARDLLGEVLTHEGYEVRAAADGAEALTICATNVIDLALVDLRMPGLDGLTVLRRIADLRPDVPVVILTAFATMDTAIAAIRREPTTTSRSPFAWKRSGWWCAEPSRPVAWRERTSTIARS